MQRALISAASIALAGANATAQGTLELVSLDSNGAQANSNSLLPAMTPDGRWIAFRSAATNLVAGDSNGKDDIFVRDRSSGITERVSIASSGAQADDWSSEPSISADGRCVAFASSASNLAAGDFNDDWDVFVRDRWSGTTEPISVDASGAPALRPSAAPAISGDGRYVAFMTKAASLGGTGWWSIVRKDRANGQIALVSRALGGAPANQESWLPRISFDGTRVLFSSYASNLVLGDTSSLSDAFVRDIAAGTTYRASVSSAGAEANHHSYAESLSADARFVAFESQASNLAPGDANGLIDVFVHDLQTSTTVRASVPALGGAANQGCFAGALSADGQSVSFFSGATNLVPGQGLSNSYKVYRKDLLTGGLEVLAEYVSTGGGPTRGLACSASGREVAFASIWPQLSWDINGASDVYVRVSPHAPPVAYCTAQVNSAGCTPSVGFTGEPSASANTFRVRATQMLNNKSGLLFWGRWPAAAPFQGGTLCVEPPTVRTPAQSTGGNAPPDDCSGEMSFHWSAGYAAAQGVAPGETIYAQYWTRDPASAATTNLTDALRFTIAP